MSFNDFLSVLSKENLKVEEEEKPFIQDTNPLRTGWFKLNVAGLFASLFMLWGNMVL